MKEAKTTAMEMDQWLEWLESEEEDDAFDVDDDAPYAQQFYFGPPPFFPFFFVVPFPFGPFGPRRRRY